MDLSQLADLTRRVVTGIDGDARDNVVAMIMGTIIMESRGRFIKQLKGGPAVGISQMEPNTAMEIVNNYLPRKPSLATKLIETSRIDPMMLHEKNREDIVFALESNLAFSIAMCRIYYRRFPEAFPEAEDIRGLGEYYKTYYNTSKGKGTVDGFVMAYNRYYASWS